MSSMFCTLAHKCKNKDWCADDFIPFPGECFEAMTNGDRIRSMSDEELAEILHNAGGNWYSEEYWLNWLKQNAEEREK